MKQSQSQIFLSLFGGLLLSISATFLHTASAKLLVIEGAEYLDSSHPDIHYPKNSEALDVIWLFNNSIRLHLNEFHVDGHSGDFVLISDQPLLDAEHFKGLNETLDASYVNDLARSIVTDQGLLLSWKMKKTIEAVNERGTFVLFHAEARDPESLAEFKGFDIAAVDYDSAITTTPPTTPDPFVTPKPGQKSPYTTKYLNCKAPQKFFKELEHFKGIIAQIATEYCNETSIPMCLDKGNITIQEVNIPAANEGEYAGLHYCDQNWPDYDYCVEVFFAITRVDSDGNYILTSDQLDTMWESKKDVLRKNQYCPYDPPAAKVDMNTLVWIAFFLGIIISLTAILALAWIKNTQTLLYYRRSFAKDNKDGPVTMGKNINDAPEPDDKHQKLYDERNPIYTYIQRSHHSRDDQLYPSGGYLGTDEGDNDSTMPIKKRSTDNPAFQNVAADVYAYDNSGFEQEERSPPPYSPRNRSNGEQLYIRTHLASLSDTEI